jgi:hypothetical protein
LNRPGTKCSLPVWCILLTGFRPRSKKRLPTPWNSHRLHRPSLRLRLRLRLLQRSRCPRSRRNPSLAHPSSRLSSVTITPTSQENSPSCCSSSRAPERRRRTPSNHPGAPRAMVAAQTGKPCSPRVSGHMITYRY